MLRSKKTTGAGSKRRLVRSFAKRAKSHDLKYTFWEVPSILTIAKAPQDSKNDGDRRKILRMQSHKQSVSKDTGCGLWETIEKVNVHQMSVPMAHNSPKRRPKRALVTAFDLLKMIEIDKPWAFWQVNTYQAHSMGLWKAKQHVSRLVKAISSGLEPSFKVWPEGQAMIFKFC